MGSVFLGRAAPPSGRYSHVAAVLGGSVLLVAGGTVVRPCGDPDGLQSTPQVPGSCSRREHWGDRERVAGEEVAWFPWLREVVGGGSWEKGKRS